MDLPAIAAVAGGGLVGAPSRYLLDRLVSDRARSALPFGTMAVNVSGSLLFGLLTGLALGPGVAPVLLALFGTGFCGAYTTFSTFTFEAVRLVEDGEMLQAGLTVLLSTLAGVGAAALGVTVGLAL